ncbi:putative BAR domain [Paratrimastix pyriformis]|uniref:BAR domain n=1 Tax=Paratrimastix pyriformis TaxID=342808 RepID=A0ABQ8UKC2_9EUKA|nr:putative BAR domain [Paratrimastix pyriformis]|eukprot:GAFH01003520.1.p2 GENE.GAFH01003520.1~~GAFH01003520.1.p2  ORF type:complete len:281 (+),score=85.99 GAFH01003520.1:46-843(+)
MEDEHLGFMDKMKQKFTQGKQLVLEKMGKADQTPEDPEFRKTLDTFKATRLTYEDLCSRSKQYSAALGNAQQHGTALAETWLSFGASQQTALGAALLKFGEVQKALEAERESLVSTIGGKMLGPMQTLLDGEIKDCREVKNRHHRLRLEYDSARNELQGQTSKKDRNAFKIQQAEAEFGKLKARFDSMQQEVADRCRNVEARKDFELLEQVVEFMDAQFTYYQQCYSKIAEVEPYLRTLQQEIRAAAASVPAEAPEAEAEATATQ